MDEDQQAMIDYDTRFERRHQRDIDDADKEAKWREDQAEHLMSKGESCYPWGRRHLAEALESLPDEALEEICEVAVLRECDGRLSEIGYVIHRAVEAYWERQAKAEADKKIYYGDEDDE
jgi:hypothetical protein